MKRTVVTAATALVFGLLALVTGWFSWFGAALIMASAIVLAAAAAAARYPHTAGDRSE